MDYLLLAYVLFILLIVAIFVALLRWVFRVNEVFNQNEEIIRLLRKLANEHD